jgi:hypothetical protein
MWCRGDDGIEVDGHPGIFMLFYELRVQRLVWGIVDYHILPEPDSNEVPLGIR